MQISESKKTIPLRILLLERVAEEVAGWWKTLLVGSGHWEDADVKNLFDPPWPVPLEMLSPEKGEEIMTRMVQLSGAEKKENELPFPEAVEWQREPLFAMMAGYLLAEKIPLPKTRAAMAITLAGWESGRIAKFAENPKQGRLLKHLAAFATLCGGLEQAQFRVVALTEKEALGLPSVGDPGTLADLLHQALPGPHNGVDALRPDIMGEALILVALGGDNPVDAAAAVQRAYTLADKKCISCLIRCGQDFIHAGHQEPLDWLNGLIEDINISLDMLWSIEQELPLNSLGLDTFAAKIQKIILGRVKSLITDDKTNESLLVMQARAANNLSNSLGNLGQRESALEAVEEVVRIDRELSEHHPDAFLPDLASSLNNLSGRLSDFGRRKDALAAIEEAVRIRRELSESHPDTFLPDLASSLNNLSVSLSALGRREDALEAAKESVRIRRELSEYHPDTFLPVLASSLNNLSNSLSDLGRHEDALEAIEESVRICHELSEHRPDAFLPY
ncbi:MAG: tetratricopeptide repeat protein [Magnetococcus sp. DMHC-1]